MRGQRGMGRLVSVVVVLSLLLGGAGAPSQRAGAQALPVGSAGAPVPEAVPAEPAGPGGASPAGGLPEAVHVVLDAAAVPGDASLGVGEALPAAARVAGAGPAAAGPAAVTVMSETFEGDFPTGAWTVRDGNGATGGVVYWDDVDNRARTGSKSAWPAAGGVDHGIPGGACPNSMDSWMVYGPVDLSDHASATLSFWYWLDSEPGHDYLYWMASANGTSYYGPGTSGNSAGWQFMTLDLTAVPVLGNLAGDASVWIAFRYTSNASMPFPGAYIDDVTLQASLLPNVRPFTPEGWSYPIVPSPVTGTHVTGPLRADGPTYVDWAMLNDSGTAAGPHSIAVYLDGTELFRSVIALGVMGGIAYWLDDYPITAALTPGTHTLRVVADVDNTVAETDETDNAWERAFVWWDTTWLPVVMR